MIVVHATIPVDPEHREEVVEEASKLAEASRAEEGVIDYRVSADVEDPNVLRFTEQYEDEEALASHGQAEHFQAFQEVLPGKLGGHPDGTRFDIESASDLDL